MTKRWARPMGGRAAARTGLCLALSAWDCTADPASVPRIASFSAAPERLNPGETVTLIWEAYDVPGVVIDPRIGPQDPVGFALDRPLVSTNYRLTVPDGSGLFAELLVEVAGAPRVLGFDATPRSLAPGESARLSWRTVDATQVRLEPGGERLPPEGGLDVTPETTTTYQLVATRGLESSEPRALTVVVAGDGPRIRTFRAEPQSVGVGDAVRLEWATEGAVQVALDQGLGPRPLAGEVEVFPQRTTVYTLSAAGPTGGVTQASLTVQVLSGEPPVIRSFAAAPGRVPPGGQSRLSWDVGEAEGVSLEPGLGGQPPKGELEVAPTETTAYRLRAFGAGAEVEATVTVEVGSGPAVLEFQARPPIVFRGGAAELVWRTDGAESVELSPGMGAVPASGSLRVEPAMTTTYTLLARGPGGPASATVTVEVAPPPPTIDTFEASPPAIELGASAELRWVTRDAVEVELVPSGPQSGPSLGPQPPSGQIMVRPAATTTYELIAQSPSGEARAEQRIAVGPPGAPAIERFTATPPEVAPGQPSILSWRVRGQATVSLDRGIGTVAAEDQTTVNPTAATSYALTADGPGGRANAQVTVRVRPRTGDTCDEAFPVRQSGVFTGDTRLGTDAIRAVASCTGFSQTGPDVVYQIPLAAGDRLRAELRPQTIGYDPSLYLLSTCTQPSSSCVAGSDSGVPEVIDFTASAGGDHFLVVDGFGGTGGRYRLDVLLNPAAVPNDDCSGAIDATAGGRFSGDTTSARPLYSPVASGGRSCTGYRADGPDVTYRVDLAAGERLEATLDALWDASLYLVTNCAQAGDTCVAGSDSGNPEAIRFVAPRAGTYFLIVDGYGGARGRFDLDVQISPPPRGGDVCEAPVTVPGPAVRFVSTTRGMTDRYQGAGCLSPQPGADRVYEATLETGDVVVAGATFDPGFDGSLYALDRCAPETCIAGSDGGGPGDAETLRFVVRRDGGHFLVVDAPATGEGDHELLALTYRGEACADAIPLTRGPEWTTTAGRADRYAPSGCVPRPPTGPDRVFRTDVRAGEQLDLQFDPSAGDAALYVLEACANPTGSCVAGSDRPGAVAERVAPVFAANRTVYAVVDGASSVTGLLSAALRGGDDCSDPYRIPPGGGTFRGTTAGFGANLGTSDGRTSCTGYSQDGADAVYEVEVPAGATLSASLTATWDAALYLVSNCAQSATTCLVGDDSGNPEVVTWQNPGANPATVFLVVDSWRVSLPTVSREGPYNLVVTIR